MFSWTVIRFSPNSRVPRVCIIFLLQYNIWHLLLSTFVEVLSIPRHSRIVQGVGKDHFVFVGKFCLFVQLSLTSFVSDPSLLHLFNRSVFVRLLKMWRILWQRQVHVVAPGEGLLAALLHRSTGKSALSDCVGVVRRLLSQIFWRSNYGFLRSFLPWVVVRERSVNLVWTLRWPRNSHMATIWAISVDATLISLVSNHFRKLAAHIILVYVEGWFVMNSLGSDFTLALSNLIVSWDNIAHGGYHLLVSVNASMFASRLNSRLHFHLKSSLVFENL